MLRRDKRSLILCLAIGDGCLHYISRKTKLYGGLTIAHSLKQADYLAWKASLVGEVLGRLPKIRPHSDGKSLQFSISAKIFRVWRKRFYPGDRKDRLRMLPFIHHPELMAAIWFCDDGSSDKDGRLRLHISAMTAEEAESLRQWMLSNFRTLPKMLVQKGYPTLQWSSFDTVTIYKVVRPFIMRFKSMRTKFARTEHRFQRVSTEPSAGRYGKDIVRSSKLDA